MSQWTVHIQDDWQRAGISLVWARDVAGGGREITNGSTGWYVTNDGVSNPNVEPLRLRDGMGPALLAALLRHYNGADDARMLRKDYDAERARVDRLIDHLMEATDV